MNDEDSAAHNPEHEDDRLERKVAGQPTTRPHRWVNRIVLAIVVLGVVAYRYRVKLLARLLGQPERRIERQIGRKKNY